MTIKTKIFYIWLVIASVFVLWRILTNPITLGFLGKLKRREVLVREQDEVLVLPEEENNAPRFSSRPLLTAVVDQTYIYEVKAVDPDGDMLTYQLKESPRGMEIAPSSGKISWTPPVVGPTSVKTEATGFVTGRVYSDEYLPEGETLSIKAVVTADNHYGLYYGSPGRLHFVGRNEIGSSGNPGTYNWSEAETFLFDLKPDDYLYVVAWDHGYAKMWLGEFQLFNDIYLRFNNKDWVSTMARGDKPLVDEVHIPSQKVL